MCREELLAQMQSCANSLGDNRLTRRVFCQHTGVKNWIVEKHFDSWSEACRVAGLEPGLPIKHFALVPHSEDDCIQELQRVACLLECNALTSKTFSRYANFSASVIIRRFGSWEQALERAGLELSDKSKSAKTLTQDECAAELTRVAQLLGKDYLTTDEFDQVGKFTSYRVVRSRGSWHEALKEANLRISPNYKVKVSTEELALAFLNAVNELEKVPSLVQLARRSNHATDTLSRNRGGYKEFKRLIVDYLLASNHLLPAKTKTLLIRERNQLVATASSKEPTEDTKSAHYQGRTLNFRAFIYAPTSEHDVVQMFGAVAHEIGFEIIGNRSAFPDCEARRRVNSIRERYEKCLIEYEFSSSDFKRHKHLVSGCDLIVCWKHNWLDCPIEVLELESEIKKLDGWR